MKNKLILSVIAIILGSCTNQNTNNMEAGMNSVSNSTNVSYQRQFIESINISSSIHLITIDTTRVLWVSKGSNASDVLLKLN